MLDAVLGGTLEVALGPTGGGKVALGPTDTGKVALGPIEDGKLDLGPVLPDDAPSPLRRLIFGGLSGTSLELFCPSRTTIRPSCICSMTKWPTLPDCLTQCMPLPGSSINARDISGFDAK
jgi:hypothetical protein